MKIISPSHDIMIPNGDPCKHIEKIGRICYRSEDAITETSAAPFVNRLFNSGHHAMLEHFRFIMEIGEGEYRYIACNNHRKYLTLTEDGRYIVSTSARGLHDMYENIVLEMWAYPERDHTNNEIVADIITSMVCAIIREHHCDKMFAGHFMDKYDEFIADNHMRIIKNFDELSDYEYNLHAWFSIHFVCDRGVTHEMVRHRDAAFAQESTRYCNYHMGKFGGEIAVIKPMFWKEDSEEYKLWWLDCMHSEMTYNSLIKCGATPQEARSVLSNSLKTEIVITAQVYEWVHIFDLRVLGKTGAPHPQIKEVMKPAYEEMFDCDYIRNY